MLGGNRPLNYPKALKKLVGRCSITASALVEPSVDRTRAHQRAESYCPVRENVSTMATP
jgi:hypothetical protein